MSQILLLQLILRVFIGSLNIVSHKFIFIAFLRGLVFYLFFMSKIPRIINQNCPMHNHFVNYKFFYTSDILFIKII